MVGAVISFITGQPQLFAAFMVSASVARLCRLPSCFSEFRQRERKARERDGLLGDASSCARQGQTHTENSQFREGRFLRSFLIATPYHTVPNHSRDQHCSTSGHLPTCRLAWHTVISQSPALKASTDACHCSCFAGTCCLYTD